jgi:hypothetical protein
MDLLSKLSIFQAIRWNVMRSVVLIDAVQIVQGVICSDSTHGTTERVIPAYFADLLPAGKGDDHNDIPVVHLLSFPREPLLSQVCEQQQICILTAIHKNK